MPILLFYFLFFGGIAAGNNPHDVRHHHVKHFFKSMVSGPCYHLESGKNGPCK